MDTIRHPVITARASQLQVQNGAAEVINNCVGQARPKGGSAKKFSEFHGDAASGESSENCQMTTATLKSTCTLRVKMMTCNATGLCRRW